ncbi:MAG: copper resistance protein CopC [Gemmatimonadaceae bacterium]
MRSSQSSTPRAVRRSAVRRVAVLLVALTAATAATALAHGALKSSTPAAGARVSVAPRELRLVFNEAPELTFTTVELYGPDSSTVALGPLQRTGDPKRTVVAAITGPLTAGTYTVRWKMAGADGHPTRGTFRFTIAPGAEGLGVAPVSPHAGAPGGEAAGGITAPGQRPPPAEHHDPGSFPEGGGFDAESAGYVALRWAQFTGLLLVLGAVAFRFVVLGVFGRRREASAPTPPSSAHSPQSPASLLRLATMAGGLEDLGDVRERAAALGMWAAVGLAVTTLLRLYAQSYAMHGGPDALDGALVSAMLGKTVWGWGWLLQAVGVVVAVAGFALVRRGKQAGWPLAAVGAAALAFTPALSGHAASSPRLPALAVLADGAHVIGAGGWLGSLLFVVAVGIPAALRLEDGEEGRRGPAVARLINAFSPTALVFAGLAAATGVFAAWLHLESVLALWQSQYGRTLLLKVGILSLVAATGAYNWLRVRPALGNIEGAHRVRRSATVELAVGLLVLVVTAVLVATPMQMDTQRAMTDMRATSGGSGGDSGTAPVGDARIPAPRASAAVR